MLYIIGPFSKSLIMKNNLFSKIVLVLLFLLSSTLVFFCTCKAHIHFKVIGQASMWGRLLKCVYILIWLHIVIYWFSIYMFVANGFWSSLKKHCKVAMEWCPPCSTPRNCLQFDIVIISVSLFSIASMNDYGAMAMLPHFFHLWKKNYKVLI